jgi:monovalent cation:H+ antiporter-2, CPA2 family
LVGSSIAGIAALATSYVFVMAIVGPVVARFAGGLLPVSASRPR